MAARPHLPIVVGSTSYGSRTDGNMLTTYTGTSQNGTSKRYSWNAANQLVKVENRVTSTSGGGCDVCQRAPQDSGAPLNATPEAQAVTTNDSAPLLRTTQTAIGGGGGTTTTTYSEIEHYIYDGDGARTARVAGGQTTVTFDGLWEDTLGVNARKLHTFGGQVVAQRDGTGSVIFLHGDKLGSISVTTDANGNLASKQEFDPWGKVRAGGVGTTTLNYTGQRLDDTGLLFCNARYYDPGLGRFISADSAVMTRAWAWPCQAPARLRLLARLAVGCRRRWPAMTVPTTAAPAMRSWR